MEESTLHARLNDGRTLPIETCSCGNCKNEWFMAALSPEWMPSFCPYCGIQFVRQETDGEPGDFSPFRDDESDDTPVDETWLHVVGGNYKYDSEDEIEDTSFIGWATSNGHDIGPSVALYVEDWQLFLDGTGVPGARLTTRGQVRKLLRLVGIEVTD
jgi:hypothetical protein